MEKDLSPEGRPYKKRYHTPKPPPPKKGQMEETLSITVCWSVWYWYVRRSIAGPSTQFHNTTALSRAWKLHYQSELGFSLDGSGNQVHTVVGRTAEDGLSAARTKSSREGWLGESESHSRSSANETMINLRWEGGKFSGNTAGRLGAGIRLKSSRRIPCKPGVRQPWKRCSLVSLGVHACMCMYSYLRLLARIYLSTRIS